MSQPLQPERLRAFVGRIAALLDDAIPESRLRETDGADLRDLMAYDDGYAACMRISRSQALAAVSAACGFAPALFPCWVLSGTWSRPTCARSPVWGSISVLRSAEIVQAYSLNEGGTLLAAHAVKGHETGAIDVVSTDIGELRRVKMRFVTVCRSAFTFMVQLSVCFALNLSVRRGRKTFISGYANSVLPNIWTVSKESVLL